MTPMQLHPAGAIPRTGESPGSAVAETVRVELHRRRATHRQLADAVGWTAASCSRRLNGAVPMTVDELFACARFLGLAVGQLLALAEADAEQLAATG